MIRRGAVFSKIAVATREDASMFNVINEITKSQRTLSEVSPYFVGQLDKRKEFTRPCKSVELISEAKLLVR